MNYKYLEKEYMFNNLDKKYLHIKYLQKQQISVKISWGKILVTKISWQTFSFPLSRYWTVRWKLDLAIFTANSCSCLNFENITRKTYIYLVLGNPTPPKKERRKKKESEHTVDFCVKRELWKHRISFTNLKNIIWGQTSIFSV